MAIYYEVLHIPTGIVISVYNDTRQFMSILDRLISFKYYTLKQKNYIPDRVILLKVLKTLRRYDLYDDPYTKPKTFNIKTVNELLIINTKDEE